MVAGVSLRALSCHFNTTSRRDILRMRSSAELGLARSLSYVLVQLINSERLPRDYLGHQIAHGDYSIELAILQNRKVPNMMPSHKRHGIKDRHLWSHGDQRSCHCLRHGHVFGGFPCEDDLSRII